MSRLRGWTWTLVIPALFALTLIPGAAAEPPGRIYVYAQRETAARAWKPVLCDGVVAAEIKRGAFFAINASGGRHTLLLDDGVPLAVEVGSQEVFVRVDWRHQVGRPPIPTLSRVGAEQAAAEMKLLRYADSKRIRSDSVSRADPRPPEQPQLRTRGEPSR